MELTTAKAIAEEIIGLLNGSCDRKEISPAEHSCISPAALV